MGNRVNSTMERLESWKARDWARFALFLIRFRYPLLIFKFDFLPDQQWNPKGGYFLKKFCSKISMMPLSDFQHTNKAKAIFLCFQFALIKRYFQIPRRAWFPSCLWSRRRGWPAFRTASPSCCPARTSRSSTPRATPSPATAKILLNDLTLNFNSVQIVKLEIFVSFYWWYKMLKSNECPWLFPGLLLLLYNTYSLQLIYDDFLLFAFSSFYIKILRKKTLR